MAERNSVQPEAVYEDTEFNVTDAYPAIDAVFGKAGWGDPLMDEYNDFEAMDAKRCEGSGNDCLDVRQRLQELHDRLAAVRGLSFLADSYAEVPTGWSGTGHATVEVGRPQEHVLTFREVGQWQPYSAKAMVFSNIYRWTFLTESVKLEHLRFGPESPVYLVDLIPVEGKLWRSAGPHVCRDDCYRAELQIFGGYIIFDWTITGPKKNERIRYIYA